MMGKTQTLCRPQDCCSWHSLFPCMKHTWYLVLCTIDTEKTKFKVPYLLTTPIRNAFFSICPPCFTFFHLKNVVENTWFSADDITALCDHYLNFSVFFGRKKHLWYVTISRFLSQKFWLYWRTSNFMRGPPESPWHVSPPPSFSFGPKSSAISAPLWLTDQTYLKV